MKFNSNPDLYHSEVLEYQMNGDWELLELEFFAHH